MHTTTCLAHARHIERCINGTGLLDGSGLRFVPVDHAGNRNESPEEAEVVASIVSDVLDSGATWIDKNGIEHVLSLSDILIVATSRAQALVVVVANPALFEPECRTPEQMKLANAFCRFREMASSGAF